VKGGGLGGAGRPERGGYLSRRCKRAPIDALGGIEEKLNRKGGAQSYLRPKWVWGISPT